LLDEKTEGRKSRDTVPLSCQIDVYILLEGSIIMVCIPFFSQIINPRIVGGVNTLQDEFPWQVNSLENSLAKSHPFHLATGKNYDAAPAIRFRRLTTKQYNRAKKTFMDKSYKVQSKSDLTILKMIENMNHNHKHKGLYTIGVKNIKSLKSLNLILL
jgi:hypothetical protein